MYENLTEEERGEKEEEEESNKCNNIFTVLFVHR